MLHIVLGDSGAWVMKSGKVCGVVIAGSDFPSEAYILPIQNVLDSIGALVPNACISVTDLTSTDISTKDSGRPFSGTQPRVYRLDLDEKSEVTPTSRTWTIKAIVLSDHKGDQEVTMKIPTGVLGSIDYSADISMEITRIEPLFTGKDIDDDLRERVVIFCATEDSRALFSKCFHSAPYEILVDRTWQFHCSFDNLTDDAPYSDSQDLVVRASFPSDLNTLCGLNARLGNQYGESEGESISMIIGGLVLVNGELFCLTVLPPSSASVSDVNAFHAYATPSGAHLSKGGNENSPHDSEIPLSITKMDPVGHIQHWNRDISWALVRLYEPLPLPNSVPIGSGSGQRFINGTRTEGDLMRLTNEEEEPEVLIATPARPRVGFLSSGNVKLKVQGQPALEVRRIVLESPLGKVSKSRHGNIHIDIPLFR
jgi:hypothetical protein